ncbi:MAG: aminotransferase class III-fold pyridoxal phosphate-dependent enzyme, partial [Anaerolineae bacterium]|nr:aminotransferase class III-fold pyridoxal phosphate-dependent enzyme [Anaerolineae bacterium]
MAEQHEAIQHEQQYIVQTYARPDFVLVRGEGTTLYDETGKAYQDWVGGIAVNALGYGDAGVNEIIQQQLATGMLHVSNLYHTEPQATLAKLLVESSFADRAFFCNSGTEANEAAIKFARRVAYNSG